MDIPLAFILINFVAHRCYSKHEQSSLADWSRNDLKIDGLVLHRDVVTANFQARLVEFVYTLLEQGRAGQLCGNTYLPRGEVFASRNQSREMLQFHVYTYCNHVQDAEVMPLPQLFEELLDDLVSRGVVARNYRPSACTVNIYQPGNWIPPHIDNRKFARPFYTVSLVSTEEIIFRKSGPFENASLDSPNYLRLALPIGSVLCLDGAAANEYLHEVPPVSRQRISLTFRRLTQEMDEHFTALKKARELKIARKTVSMAKKDESTVAAHADEIENATFRPMPGELHEKIFASPKRVQSSLVLWS